MLFRKRKPPGLVVFFTGLSGSGKTTIADALRLKLEFSYKRNTDILDGDIVRKLLCSELGFSKEHRDLNIARIGYVASRIAKHGGIAICAAIAPYDLARKDVRYVVTEAGGTFVLVYLSTPLSICEDRDVKGLYKQARKGELKHFTGVSDPYERPTDYDILLDTGTLYVNQCVEKIINNLRKDHLL
jgi:sulfate adenylyltransferase